MKVLDYTNMEIGIKIRHTKKCFFCTYGFFNLLFVFSFNFFYRVAVFNHVVVSQRRQLPSSRLCIRLTQFHPLGDEPGDASAPMLRKTAVSRTVDALGSTASPRSPRPCPTAIPNVSVRLPDNRCQEFSRLRAARFV